MAKKEINRYEEKAQRTGLCLLQQIKFDSLQKHTSFRPIANAPLRRNERNRRQRRFVSVKNVKGGGEKNGQYLGKVVRWYYPKGEAGYIAYVGSGNKVGKTDGARPLMDLPEELPDDINYDWYINEAIEMLYDCGAYKKAETAQLFF